MNLSVTKALPEEAESIVELYHLIIEQLPTLQYHPKWTRDVYPADDYLRESVMKGEMYRIDCDGKPVGGMILNGHEVEGYESAPWSIKAAPDEVGVIHTLGILPPYANRGIGSFAVTEAMDILRKQGKRVIRLDVLLGNLPAEKLYKRLGFSFVQRVRLYYEDTGWCEFDLYEKNISEN